ncbi:MAG: aminopeptidase, partial [Firmicutes bacterium]|nr:aminopeptidase [Bacillota bacterium]
RVYRINREKSVAFAIIGKEGCKNGFRLVVSHVDSPRLDLKPHPLYEKNELALFKTHYYGGIKKYQWTTLPLALHGKVILKDGTRISVVIGEKEDDPCFCVTDLLPHLAKEQMAKAMTKAIEGEDLNVLVGSLPFKTGGGSELVKLNILNILNEKYGIIESDFSFAEFEMVPAFKARDIGFDKSLIGAYGHDDRCCGYTSFQSLINLKIPEKTCIALFVDKEEIGSDGNTGMKSSFAKHFLGDLTLHDGIKNRIVFYKSKAISADVNAAFDPNFAAQYDALNSSYINKGVVITKYTGSGGKAGASDASAEFMGEIREMFERKKIVWQSGQLGKVDAGGGGTVAKYVANLNIDVVDMGIPLLSMHAPFEVISKLDLYEMSRAISAFFE